MRVRVTLYDPRAVLIETFEDEVGSAIDRVGQFIRDMADPANKNHGRRVCSIHFDHIDESAASGTGDN